MSEYVPNTEEALGAYKQYKRHQFKLKWLPFYRQWHRKKSLKDLDRKYSELNPIKGKEYGGEE